MKRKWKSSILLGIVILACLWVLGAGAVTAEELLPADEPSAAAPAVPEGVLPPDEPLPQHAPAAPAEKATESALSFTAVITNNEEQNGRFTVIITPANTAAVKRVSVPIWSQANQSDILWYPAQKQGDGTYRVDFDYQNHQYNKGSYKVHVYAYGDNGQSQMAGIDEGGINIQPEITGEVSVVDKNGKQSLYQASIKVKSSVKGVLFPTWTDEGGQDDIRWYAGSYNPKTDSWTVDIPLANHLSGGLTKTHVYAETKDGLLFINNVDFDLPKPVFTEATIDKTHIDSGRFTVNLRVDSPAGIKQVVVPTWSKANQSDIVWYQAQRQKDGSYRVDVDFKNHQYNVGTYKVHAYVHAPNGQVGGIAVDNNLVVSPPKITGEVSVADKNGKQSVYQATAKLNSSAKGVLFPTWTEEKGQDDIRWYSGTYNAKSDSWTVDIPLANHLSGGRTITHVYAETNWGLQFITSTDFALPKPSFTKTAIDQSNARDGKFRVDLSVASSSGVKQVLVPIWSKANQSDIVWYEAKRQLNGTYRVDFDYRNHNYNAGDYRVHAYLYAPNGQVGAANVTGSGNDVKINGVTASNFKVTDISGNQTRYRLSLEASTRNGVKGVTFPTWTDLNGQDDIRWHSAKYNVLTKAWEVDVTLRQYHFNGTLFHVHAYAEMENRNLAGLGATTLTVPESSLSQYVNHRGNHNRAPENSIPSFENANYYGVETDIRLSADGKWVIMHDDTIDRMTNGSGHVNQLTYAQLRQYRIDVGHNVGAYPENKRVIPTLEEYLTICQSKGKVPVIEIKTNQINDAAYNDLAAIINSYGYADSCYVISFYLEPLQAMKRKMPELQTMYLTGEISNTTIAQAKSIGSKSGLNVIWNSVNAGKISQAKGSGLVTGVWTVPSSQFGNMRGMNVDYITTDD